MVTKRSFKNVGANILKPSGPKSMTEFLNTADAEPKEQPKSDSISSDAQMHICTDAHLHKADEPPKDQPRDERLHVFINGDLAESLADEVHRRKKSRDYDKAKASKRGVVEDALRMYFE